MNALFNIIKKEIKELLTITTLVSVIVIVIVFASMGSLVDTTVKKAQKKPVISVVNLSSGKYSELFIKTCTLFSKTVYEGKDQKEAFKKLKADSKGVALVIIPKDFDKKLNNNERSKIKITWIMRGSGTMDIISSAVLIKLLDKTYKLISKQILTDKTSAINPDIILNPIKAEETTIYKTKTIHGTTPGKIAKILVNQSVTIPIVIMIIIMLGGSMVITSMGMEKENKTLETLLTMPVKREYIVLGKILGGAVVGFIMAMIFMLGFKYYMSSFSVPESSLKMLGLDLGILDYTLISISLFMALLCGLSLSMLLGVLARDYKSAQILTYPILTLTIIPMFVNMFKDFDTIPAFLKVIVFIIPFSHPMMAVGKLSLDEYSFVIWGIAYTFILSLLITYMVVKVFKSEKLITGFFS